MEFYVIAEEEIVIGFRFVGVDGAVAGSPDQAREAFKVAVDPAGAVRVLILTEEVSSMIESDVLEWQASGEYPLIVEVPGLHGRMKGKQTLVDSIREAVGIHV